MPYASSLQNFDPQLYAALQKEAQRQVQNLELIPSENYVSAAVLEALGSILTNKYSEGYIGNRYYGGCEYIDLVEGLAIERAKEIFGAEHVNVQPLSGAPANTAVYFAMMQPGDTILGMDLSHGGHLTHGHPVTTMAKLYNFIRYKTRPDGEIDYDQIRDFAKQHKPKIILVGYSAYSREIQYDVIRDIAREVGAYTMADIAHISGLIAAKEMSNPVSDFDIVTSTTHKTLRGPRGGMILCKSKFASMIDKAVFPGFQGGPHENVIAAIAVALKEALLPEFKIYASQVKKNAKVLEEELRNYGLTIMFGKTENHLLLLDVTPKGLTGKEAQIACDKAHITLNKNMIPNDQRKPMDPSGIRLGTPAITTRGMKEAEMKLVAGWINDAIEHHTDDEKLAFIGKQVQELCSHFPVPGI